MSLASPFFSPRAAGRSAVSLVSPASFQLFKHISQISFQLLHAHVFGTAQIKMKHWMLDLFLLIICNGQSFEKFFPSLKISLKGRGKKKKFESSWATQKDVLHLFLSKINDVFGLIYIEIIALSDIRECLYSYRIEIYYFCHISTCFTFCVAKLAEHKFKYFPFCFSLCHLALVNKSFRVAKQVIYRW